MEIILKSNTKKVKKLILNDLYWYDHIEKKMWTDKGTYISFEYSKEKKRSVPVAIKDEQNVVSNNYEDILKWINANKRQFNIEVTHVNKPYNVYIECGALSFEEIEQSLIRHKIVFDYDQKELSKELKYIKG